MWNLGFQVIWVAMLNRAVICRRSFHTPHAITPLPRGDLRLIIILSSIRVLYTLDTAWLATSRTGCNVGHYKKHILGAANGGHVTDRVRVWLALLPAKFVLTAGWFISTVLIVGSFIGTVLVAGSFIGTVLVAGSFIGTVLVAGSFNGTVLVDGSFKGTVLPTRYHSSYHITVIDLGEARVTCDGQEERIQYFGEDTCKNCLDGSIILK